MIDWKKVADKRLRELRANETWRRTLRAEIYAELRRSVAMALHARCISRANELADSIAHDVSISLTTP